MIQQLISLAKIHHSHTISKIIKRTPEQTHLHLYEIDTVETVCRLANVQTNRVLGYYSCYQGTISQGSYAIKDGRECPASLEGGTDGQWPFYERTLHIREGVASVLCICTCRYAIGSAATNVRWATLVRRVHHSYARLWRVSRANTLDASICFSFFIRLLQLSVNTYFVNIFIKIVNAYQTTRLVGVSQNHLS